MTNYEYLIIYWKSSTSYGSIFKTVTGKDRAVAQGKRLARRTHLSVKVVHSDTHIPVWNSSDRRGAR